MGPPECQATAITSQFRLNDAVVDLALQGPHFDLAFDAGLHREYRSM